MQRKIVDIKRLIDNSKELKLKLPGKNAAKTQLRVLKKLLHAAENTEFGEMYKFKNLLNSSSIYHEYSKTVPLGDYSTMLPWWEKAREGNSDITWPGYIDYYALSSGTTDGSSKYIPVSAAMIKAVRRVSLRQILSIIRSDVPKDHISKHWLMIGGSTDLDYNGTFYYGDLSGITTGNIPTVFQRVSKPDPIIKSTCDWEEKLTKMTLEAKNWDIGMVAGVPAWVKILFERIIAHYKLKNIHEIWPHLEVYIHGGVSLIPYKSGLDDLMGRPIKYYETYLASEGFIAYQNRENSQNGMKLNLRQGLFYEFIPFNQVNFDSNCEILPNATALPIWEVQENKEYALVLSSCSGAWRYLIGDTIKFINLKKNEIIITGRTKHFLSICGEHLSVDNMNQGIKLLGQEYDCQIMEYTVSGFKDPLSNKFTHHWFIASNISKVGEKRLMQSLDYHLGCINDDYKTERLHALEEVKMTVLPHTVFIDWMKEKNKLGSQNKFPRVLKGDLWDDWLNFTNSQ